jgi:hypothetical protein
VVLIIFGSATAQKLSNEELVIKLVIERDTEYFSNGSYDAWESLWEHSSTIFWAYYTPELKKEITSWDDLNSFLKEKIKKNAENPAVQADNSDYKFFVTKNTALVTFIEGTNQSTRVLIKNKGEWKLIQMTVSKSGLYKRAERIKLFRSYLGKWTIDKSTFKVGDNWPHALEGFNGCIVENDGVFLIRFTGVVKMNNNKPFVFKSEARLGFDFQTGEISAFVESIGENHYDAFGGKGELIDRELKINYYSILNPKLIDSEAVMGFNENGTIKCSDKYFDKDGNVTQTFDYILVRQL